MLNELNYRSLSGKGIEHFNNYLCEIQSIITIFEIFCKIVRLFTP
jgi:hypothetical protein